MISPPYVHNQGEQYAVQPRRRAQRVACAAQTAPPPASRSSLAVSLPWHGWVALYCDAIYRKAYVTESASARDPRDLLPLTPPMFHIMVALADEERHGYGIIKDVTARTAGDVTIATGTLYGIIKRLLADGLVVESQRRPPAAHDDERRVYYRLTPFGRRVVAAEIERLESAVRSARGTRTLRKVPV
jgi:DNA-binding PadR family transcriptional regulator